MPVFDIYNEIRKENMIRALIFDENPDFAAKTTEFFRANFSDIDIKSLGGRAPESSLAQNYDMLVFSENAFERYGIEIIEKFRAISQSPVIYVFPDTSPARKLNLGRGKSDKLDSVNESGKLLVVNPVLRGIPIPGNQVEINDNGEISNERGNWRSDLDVGQWKKNEINNLLMAIIGNVQILRARPGIDSEELKRKLIKIEQNAKIIARINGHQDIDVQNTGSRI